MNPTQAEVLSLFTQLFGITPNELNDNDDLVETKPIINESASEAENNKKYCIVGRFNDVPSCINFTTQQKGTKMTQKIAGVVCLDNLTANQYRQLVTHQGVKVFHQNEAEAIAEAERLARANPGKTFGTVVLVATSTVAQGVTTRL